MYAVRKDGNGFRCLNDEKDLKDDEIICKEMPEIKKDLMDDASGKIKTILDSAAQKLGYDNMITAASYASDPFSKYSDDAKKLIAYRSNVWQAALSVKKPKSVDDILSAVKKVEV